MHRIRNSDKRDPNTFDEIFKRKPKPTYPTVIKLVFDPMTGEMVGYKKITDDNTKE